MQMSIGFLFVFSIESRGVGVFNDACVLCKFTAGVRKKKRPILVHSSEISKISLVWTILALFQKFILPYVNAFV